MRSPWSLKLIAAQAGIAQSCCSEERITGVSRYGVAKSLFRSSNLQRNRPDETLLDTRTYGHEMPPSTELEGFEALARAPKTCKPTGEKSVRLHAYHAYNERPAL